MTLENILEEATRDINKVKIADTDPMFQFKIVMVLFLFKAISICQSILRILQSDPTLYHESGILARSLLELYVHAKYIRMEPKEFSERFLRYNDVWRHRYKDSISKLNPRLGKKLNSNVTKSIELEERYENYIAAYGKQNLNCWAGKTLRQMAEDVEESWLYYQVYRLQCKYVHPDSDTLAKYMHIDEFNISIYRDHNPVEVERILATCFSMFAQLYLICDKEFSLGKEEWIRSYGIRFTTIDDKNSIRDIASEKKCPFCHEHTVVYLDESEKVVFEVNGKSVSIDLMTFGCQNDDCIRRFYVPKELYPN